MTRLIDWLRVRHAAAVERALARGFFGHVSARVRGLLERLRDDVGDLVRLNAYEWLLAEARLAVGGSPPRSVHDLLARPGAPLLEAHTRQWVASLARHPLSLFEVSSSEPGRGLWCVDLLRLGSSRLWLREPVGSRMVTEGQILGLRPIGVWGEYESSGAIYPFASRAEALDVAARLVACRGVCGASRGTMLARCWLRSLTGAAEPGRPGAAAPTWEVSSER